MEKIRKPIREEHRKLFKPDTKFVWLTCSKCGCEYEVTERQNNLSKSIESYGERYKLPNLCYDCFLEEDDE